MADEDTFVTIREFDRTVRSLENAIKESNNRTDYELRRQGDALKELAAEIKKPLPAPVTPPEALSTAAAIHRGIEALTLAATAPQPRRAGWQGPAFWMGLPVIGFLVWKAFLT